MKQYGVMVIGCGHIGCQHLEDIYWRDNIRIEATVDADENCARTAARKYGAADYGTDYRKFLSDPSVDIVIIATYASSHLSVLKDCLTAGKHVLCEKPIATNKEDGKEFFELAKGANRKVLIAHILRHNASYNKICELIKSGVIGKFKVARMVQNHHCIDWNRYKRLLKDCSPLVDCGVHYIDVLQWMTGAAVTEVSGMETIIDEDCDYPNYGLMQMKLSDGSVGYYEAAWSRNTASENLKEFIGDKGRISLTLKENRTKNAEEGDLISVYHNESGEYEDINVPSVYKNMYGQLCCLIDMIENEAPANPTLDEAYSAFLVALAADEAAKTGKIIKTDVTVG